MHHVHPAVVKRKAHPQSKTLRAPSLLDIRLLTWPQRHEIAQEFAAAQRQGNRSQGLPRGFMVHRPENEPPDDAA
jgi:hypothetical protein